MHAPETTNLLTAGFYIVRFLPRPEALGALLPQRLLTLSTCLTDTFPDTWTLDWTTDSDAVRISAAAHFGISEDALPKVVADVSAAFSAGEVAWPNVWTSLATARRAARRLQLSPAQFALVELSVPTDIAELLLEELEPSPGEAPAGLCTQLQRHEPPAEGLILGWELLGVEYAGDFHSWLCNSLHHDAHRQLDITPGALGLLACEHHARAVADMIASGAGAEPVPWFPGQLRYHAW